jgi:hypothetical protein
MIGRYSLLWFGGFICLWWIRNCFGSSESSFVEWRCVCWKIFFFLVCYFEILNLSSFFFDNFLLNSRRELIVLFLFKLTFSWGINHNSIPLLFSIWYQELRFWGFRFRKTLPTVVFTGTVYQHLYCSFKGKFFFAPSSTIWLRLLMTFFIHLQILS